MFLWNYFKQCDVNGGVPPPKQALEKEFTDNLMRSKKCDKEYPGSLE